MTVPTTIRRVDTLSIDECLGLLEARSVGRVVFVDAGEPHVLPVNYHLHQGTVVFRTGYGALLDAVHLAPVAFEVDAIDADYRTGWSVVVRGRAEEIWRPEHLAEARQLPLRPWAPGSRDHYVRILPREITGRRIT